MNPVPGIALTDAVRRVHQQPGERKRRDPAAGEQFRRALQERTGEGAAGADADATDGAPEPTPPAPPTPSARALQRQAPTSRREQGLPKAGALARHVDVLA